VSALALLTLDALGTLVRLAPPAPALAQTLGERFGVRLETGRTERAIAAEIAYYRAHMEEGRDAASLLALRERCAEVLRNALCEPDQNRPSQDVAAMALVPLDQLSDALLASLRFSVYPDAVEALRDARARGLGTLVISNWDISLSGVLDSLGLSELLDGVLTSAAAGARKPAAEIFHRALQIAGGVAPERALHVGDDLQADYEGARAAGLRALLVCRGRPAPPGIDAIGDLVALRAVMDAAGPP
jgi:putative hydrolase of the HAD superfamily